MNLEEIQSSNLRLQSNWVSRRRFVEGNSGDDSDRTEAYQEDLIERTVVENTNLTRSKGWVEAECAASGVYQVGDVNMA